MKWKFIVVKISCLLIFLIRERKSSRRGLFSSCFNLIKTFKTIIAWKLFWRKKKKKPLQQMVNLNIYRLTVFQSHSNYENSKSVVTSCKKKNLVAKIYIIQVVSSYYLYMSSNCRSKSWSFFWYFSVKLQNSLQMEDFKSGYGHSKVSNSMGSSLSRLLFSSEEWSSI